MARRRTGIAGMWLLGSLTRGIAPRETVRHTTETEDKIPKLHVKATIIYIDTILAIMITLGLWWTGWFARHGLTNWSTIRQYLMWLFQWATWPGILIAFGLGLRARIRELSDRHWENWRMIRYVTDLAFRLPSEDDEITGLPPVTQLGKNDISEDALNVAFTDTGIGDWPGVK